MFCSVFFSLQWPSHFISISYNKKEQKQSMNVASRAFLFFYCNLLLVIILFFTQHLVIFFFLFQKPQTVYTFSLYATHHSWSHGLHLCIMSHNQQASCVCVCHVSLFLSPIPQSYCFSMSSPLVWSLGTPLTYIIQKWIISEQ